MREEGFSSISALLRGRMGASLSHLLLVRSRALVLRASLPGV